jgi:hypothetical protein
MTDKLDTLNLALTQVILKATEGVEQGINFLGEQIPDVAQQVLVYNLSSALLWLFLGVALLVATNKTASWWRSCWEDTEDKLFATVICFTVGGIPSVVIIVCNMQVALKIWLAPKLYLLEYAASLVK